MLFLIRVKYTFFYASPQSKPTYHRLTFGVTKGKKQIIFRSSKVFEQALIFVFLGVLGF